MADTHDFERRLGRLFDDAPSFPDAALFAARVQERLDAKDGVRRAVMGLVGGVGAFVAAAQLVRANMTAEFVQAATASNEAVERGWTTLAGDAGALITGGMMPTEVMWTAAALGAMAVAFLATRAADAF
jgi:hypothetical protein